MVRAQIDALIAERPPDALKLGALASAAIVRCVAEAIVAHALPQPVIDPVLLSSSGTRLLDRGGEEALRALLLPTARVVTPNLPEAAALSGIAINSAAARREAARILRRLGARAVVIKGGHLLSDASPASVGRGRASSRPRRRSPKLLRLAGNGAHMRPVPPTSRVKIIWPPISSTTAAVSSN